MSFGYGNDQWKDQLTTVTKGNTTKTITYDAVGNPTSFYDGFLYSMEWSEGRNLTKLHYHYDANDPSVARTTTYQYNADGLRTKKINPNGTYTVYHIADGRYVGETQFTADNKVILYIRYVLDESGSVVGIGLWKSGDVAWTDFYFLKNLQGDVIQVYRESDNALMASYEYDAWGNIVDDQNYAYFAGKAIKDLNPFRYRGYYYDNETWFYYLQSRYYDPAIGRFINADAFASTGQGFTGNNMYVYCLNNPVMYVDPNGEFPWIIIPLIIPFIIAGCSYDDTTDELTSNPRSDLANAPDLNIQTDSPESYNCYGNGIGKQICTDPTGYTPGDSTRDTFNAVKQDLGSNNVRELSSINDPIGPDEFMVALKCGPADYHFIRKDGDEWYNKSGLAPGLYIDQSVVERKVWYAMWINNGKVYASYPSYNYETIYFAVKVGWDEQ